MNKLKEIVRVLEVGKEIRRKTWSKDSCWKLKDGVLYNNKGESIDDWEIVEEKKTLSDYIIESHNFQGTLPSVIPTDRVRKEIKEFINWCETVGYKDREPSLPFREKAKEIFGGRLIK